jgi:hypothetical protein
VPRLFSSARGLFWLSASTLTFLIFLTSVRCLPCQLGVQSDRHSRIAFRGVVARCGCRIGLAAQRGLLGAFLLTLNNLSV